MSDASGSDGAYPQAPIQFAPLDSSPAQGQAGWSYEATVKRVEEIVARIEAGNLELAEVFDQFAIAIKYLQECDAFLAQRQKQVDLLIETLTDDSEF